MRRHSFIQACLFCTRLFVHGTWSSPIISGVREEFKYTFLSNDTRTQTSLIDQEIYRSFADFAYEAYCPETPIGSIIGKDATLLWKLGNGINVQYVHLSYSPTYGIVIAYEGTNSSSAFSVMSNFGHELSPPIPDLDWLGNVQLANSVQSGWKLTSDQVQEQVGKALDKFPNATIHVTGHSLGAAIGLIGALNLSRELQRDVEVTLFGMPRIGNADFADAVDKYLPRQRRVVNGRDPVPHVPALVLGYRHPSGEVFIEDYAKQQVFDCIGQENVNCSFGMHWYRLTDHLIGNYGSSMKSCDLKANRSSS